MNFLSTPLPIKLQDALRPNSSQLSPVNRRSVLEMTATAASFLMLFNSTPSLAAQEDAIFPALTSYRAASEKVADAMRAEGELIETLPPEYRRRRARIQYGTRWSEHLRRREPLYLFSYDDIATYCPFEECRQRLIIGLDEDAARLAKAWERTGVGDARDLVDYAIKSETDQRNIVCATVPTTLPGVAAFVSFFVDEVLHANLGADVEVAAMRTLVVALHLLLIPDRSGINEAFEMEPQPWWPKTIPISS